MIEIRLREKQKMRKRRRERILVMESDRISELKKTKMGILALLH